MYKRRTTLSTMTKKYDKTSGLIAISRHVGRAVRDARSRKLLP